MPLVPEVKVLLDQLATVEPVPVEQQTPELMRAGWKALTAMMSTDVEMARVEQRSLPGPATDLALRVYTPLAPSTGPRPVLVWFHGGGFVIGDLETADFTARSLADASGALVVSVDYRLAPEHPHPAAVEDCYGALCWISERAAELGGDSRRIAVGGDSAGGNLAAVTALKARDRGGPDLVFQLLVYPVIDAAMDTTSYRDNAEGYLLTTQTMRWFWECYLGPHGDPSDPLASPLRAENLAGLPPALIITAEYDPLRDEGEAYGAALEAAGVPVRVSRYDGEVHAFFAAPKVFGEPAALALTEAATALAKAFAG